MYDGFIKVSDQEAFDLTRELVAKEGLLVGPSSGLALMGALKASEKMEKSSNIVVIFPDSGRAYLSKAFNNQWMVENGLRKAEEIKNAFGRVILAEQALADLQKNKE
jgi:cystathionine beta-synthase